MPKRAWDMSKLALNMLTCSIEHFPVLRNSVEICKFFSKCAENMPKRAWDMSKLTWDMLTCSREHFPVLRNSVKICKFFPKCAQNMPKMCMGHVKTLLG